MQGVKAMTIYPFILVGDIKLKDDLKLMNHEKIHLKQQLEMLVIPFYVWYLSEYIFRITQYWMRGELARHYGAYMNISFEREAYANQNDYSYLSRRDVYSWTKYLKTKK